jgi:hypothetical protein
MLVIFVALRRIFSRLSVSLCSGFRCSVIEFGATATYLRRRFGRRSSSLTLLRDVLNIIISKIVNWLGAVSAQ